MVERAPSNAKVVEGDVLILPRHIDTKEHFWEAFGSCELEDAARRAVHQAQKVGTWGPLELEFGFALLASYGWLVKGEDGLYRVTNAFITRCYEKSPAT